MARREHVYGPYERKNGWEVVYVTPGGKRLTRLFPQESEARREADKARAKLEGRQLSDALRDFLQHSTRRGLRPGTVTTLGYRLRAVLQIDEDDGRAGGPIADLTPARAARLVEEYPRSVDTMKGSLAACRAFAAFCVSKRWLRADPFAACVVVGRKKRGKPQLTEDEAREFYHHAFELASKGDRPAIAALLYLVLGCRASEVTERTARDIDARGTILLIPHGKTHAAARRLVIPEPLRPLVAKLLRRKGQRLRPADYLFDRGDGQPPTKDWALWHVRRICRLAGVTEITTHSLRGLQSTLATAANAPAEAVAAQLGHASPAVTDRHYTAAGAKASARGARVLAVLDGGRS
jgi:integrase